MKRISCLVDRPREVTLGGRIFLVGEMRLSDLADLQVYLDGLWKDPLEALWPSLDGLPEADRRKALLDIWDACEAGPMAYGSPRAQKLFDTDGEALVEILRVVLTRHQPGMTREEIIQVAEKATYPEYARMMRVFRPVETIDELAHLLKLQPVHTGGSVTWVKAIMHTCEAYHWTIDYVMGLTMRQFSAARSGGTPVEYGVSVKPKSGKLKKLVRAMRQAAGMDKKEGTPDGA